MRKVVSALLFLVLPAALSAQSIKIDTVIQLGHCVNDPVRVAYTATGNFDPTNHFTVRISPDSVSYTTLYVDTSVKPIDTLTLYPGAGYYSVLVYASSPDTSSPPRDSSVRHVALPKPYIWSTNYPVPFYNLASYPRLPILISAGLAGHTVKFKSTVLDGTWSWSFGPDATPSTSTESRPSVTFASEGIKQGVVTQTDTNGCSVTDTFLVRICSCTAHIPANVTVPPDSDGGKDTLVLVKSGRTYYSYMDQPDLHAHATIFLEAGATAHLGNAWGSTIFMLPGAHVVDDGANYDVSIFLQDGERVTWTKYFDTFYCSSLAFDYEQAQVQQAPSSPIVFRYYDDHAVVSAVGEISMQLFDILGDPVRRREGTENLDLDLTRLPGGVYFADIRAGNRREIRRILR